MACAAVVDILAKVKSDCFESNLKIFNCIVKSTLTYGAAAWALKYTHVLEAIQSFYFKRIFRLPICTPAYLLRLEFNLEPLEVTILGLTLSWIVKVVNMQDDRLPKICFLREVHLFFNRDPNMSGTDKKRFYKFNWVGQVDKDWGGG